MASKCNNAVLGPLLLAVGLVNACARHEPPQCGGVHDYDDHGNVEHGVDWDRSKPVRYVEKPAEPSESATNGPPNWLTTPITFQGIELVHFFPTEQAVHRSIPFYVELPDEYEKWKVFLRYKLFGGLKWTKVEMKKHGRGRVAEIPCLEVDTAGRLRYYLEVDNADNEIEELIGSRKEPFSLEVRQEIKSGQPVIEGWPLPTRCVIESP